MAALLRHFNYVPLVKQNFGWPFYPGVGIDDHFVRILIAWEGNRSRLI